MYTPVHEKKIISMRMQDLQDCITAKSSKSQSTVGNMRTIVRGMWSYAVANEYVETDITQHLCFEYTQAGTPIHDAIVPLIRNRLDQNRRYLITNKYGNHYTRAVYHNSNWNTVMQRMNLEHCPHDGRYTFAALADQAGMNETCRKIIMGHALGNKTGTAWKTGGKSDVTRDVYTEKTLAELLTEVNKLPVTF